jgi:hypothetical protein
MCRDCHIHARIAGYDFDQDGDRVDGERRALSILLKFP